MVADDVDLIKLDAIGVQPCTDHVHVLMGMKHEHMVYLGPGVEVFPLEDTEGEPVGYMHVLCEVIVCMN